MRRFLLPPAGGLLISLAGLAFALPADEKSSARPPVAGPAEVAALAPAGEGEVNEADNASRYLVYGPPRKDLSRDVMWRHQAVGRRVRVEGIAWGQPWGKEGERDTISPHAGPKVIYEGGAVFVPGIDLDAKGARGKTVRVLGTLRLRPEGATRWGKIEKWYYIEPESVEVIDHVSDPRIVLAGAE